MRSSLLDLFEILLGCYGPQGWWPLRGKGDSKLEIAIGAILVQNTSWRNAERAIDRIIDAGLMGARDLYYAGEGKIAEIIRPAGFFLSKAKAIYELVKLIIELFSGKMEGMFELPVDVARELLLGIKGIGPETADTILLYAGNKPIFVVDSYAIALMRCERLSFPLPPEISSSRKGKGISRAEYGKWQKFFHENLPADPYILKEFHALIVEHGKRGYCKGRSEEECKVCKRWEEWQGVQRSL